MSLKILGGEFKGYKVQISRTTLVRPTSVLLRRKIFDRYQDISEYCFIDACSGSGIMGLEAYSRGAKRLFLIEKDIKTLKHSQLYLQELIVRRNRSVQQVRCIASPIERWLKTFKKIYSSFSEIEKNFTLFFFDPPYDDLGLYRHVLNFFFQNESAWYRGDLLVEARERGGEVLSIVRDHERYIRKRYRSGERCLYLFKSDGFH